MPAPQHAYRSRFSPVHLISLLFLVSALASTAWAQPPPAVVPAGVDISKPITLPDAVRIALANSPAMPIATQGAVRAEAGATQVRSAELPNLSASFNVQTGKSLGSGGLGGGTNTSHVLQLALSQTFYQSGLREDVKAAQAAADASRFGINDARRTLVLTVAQDYYAALATRAFVDVSRRAVMTSRTHLEAANARIEAGVAAMADRYPFEVELSQAQVQAITAENQAELAVNTLKNTLGLAAQTPLRFAEELARPPLPGKITALVQAAYQTRPDVLEQKATVESAQQSLKAATIRRGPVLSADGSVGVGDFSGNKTGVWQLAAGVSVPLFDGYLTKGKEDAARANLKIAEESLRSLELAISAQVEANYLSATLADSRIEASSTALRAAQISLDAAQEKYVQGVGTVIDVTDAELKLRQAEADSVQALYDYNTALVSLRASLGQPVAAGVEEAEKGK